MLGKCVYYSYDFSEKAANWTQARQKCSGAYAGAKLASIKDQAAQDAFYSNDIMLPQRGPENLKKSRQKNS